MWHCASHAAEVDDPFWTITIFNLQGWLVTLGRVTMNMWCRYTIVAESRNKGIPHALHCIPRLRQQSSTKRPGPCSQSLATRPFTLSQTCSLQSHVFSVVPFSLRDHARADTSWSRKHTSRTCRRMSAPRRRNVSSAKPHPSHHPPPTHHCHHFLPPPHRRHHHPWRRALTLAPKSRRSRACAMSCREWRSSRTAAASLLTKRTTADPFPH